MSRKTDEKHDDYKGWSIEYKGESAGGIPSYTAKKNGKMLGSTLISYLKKSIDYEEAGLNDPVFMEKMYLHQIKRHYEDK